MKTEILIDLTFDQILSIVKQLPSQQKLELSKELESEVINSKLSELLNAFETDDLDINTITKDVESLRQKIHGQQTH